MIPVEVRIFVCVEPVDMRHYAEYSVMRSCNARVRPSL
jgi:hypothetical protein